MMTGRPLNNCEKLEHVVFICGTIFALDCILYPQKCRNFFESIQDVWNKAIYGRSVEDAISCETELIKDLFYRRNLCLISERFASTRAPLFAKMEATQKCTLDGQEEPVMAICKFQHTNTSHVQVMDFLSYLATDAEMRNCWA